MLIIIVLITVSNNSNDKELKNTVLINDKKSYLQLNTKTVRY